jgi:hypothetical protein
MRNTLSALTLSALAALLLATPVTATPLETGCPPGYAAKTVVEWEAMGDYLVPRRVEEAGNQDGIICGRALPDGFLFWVGDHGQRAVPDGRRPLPLQRQQQLGAPLNSETNLVSAGSAAARPSPTRSASRPWRP